MLAPTKEDINYNYDHRSRKKRRKTKLSRNFHLFKNFEQNWN